MTKEEQGFSNEFRLTRLVAKIIKANLNKSFIEIGSLIVRDFHSQGVVIKKHKDDTFGLVAVEPLIKED